ncbi:MAG: ROK family protein [Candidatus Omnitrophica bacterium]|nr:ROK family protein [Candidatus Omnitrophota bacterium]
MGSKYILHKINILKVIYEKGRISRKKLHEFLDIRFATITEIVKELKKEGIIKEVGREKNQKSGRPCSLLSIIPDSKFFIGCELTPYNIISVVLNFNGSIVEKVKLNINLNDEKEKLQREIIKVLSNLINKVEKNKIYGIGFVDPGIVDIENGISLFSSIMPKWKDVHIKRHIEENLSIETFVIGSSQAKVLSEKFFGKGKKCKNFIFVEYGDGISCGVISDDKVIHGVGGVAGEFGHIKIIGRNEICKCGKKGCLESIASIPGILNNIKRKTGEILNINLVLEKYKSGDLEIKKNISEIFEIFAVSISNLINLFNPEMIIFDKNFQIFNDFFDLIFEKIKANMVYNYPVKFEISHFGEEIGAIGGACLSMSKFLKLDI